MGECGCTSGNKAFKLKAPDGWYVFQMAPGCDYCCVGPSIRISMVGTSQLYYEDELEHIPDLPIIGKDNESMVVINCGIPKDQAVNAAIKIMVGANADNDGIIDEVLAEILGEDFWENALTDSPSVIYPSDNGE